MKERTKYRALLNLCVSATVLALLCLYGIWTGNVASARIVAVVLAAEAVAIVVIRGQRTERQDGHKDR